VFKQKIPIVLIYGYPLSIRFFGGLIWIKKVVEYLEKSEVFSVRKVSNGKESRGRIFPRILTIRALLQIFFINPKITILDTYGDAAIWMWILLRIFRPGTKVVTIFHHYEPFFVRHKKSGKLSRKYWSLLDHLTIMMLKNSDSILTVSNASLNQLKKILRIRHNQKIVVVGCSNSDGLSVAGYEKRDLDFLCVGRFEKFNGIENIWNIIKKKNPTSKFVMIGRVSSEDLTRLRDIGIDHRGIVSEENKVELYGRAKVLLFPSLFEGFGMAITEALSARLSIVAWKIPVFEERFEDCTLNNGELIEIGNHGLFAQKALLALDGHDKWLERSPAQVKNFNIDRTWNDVGKNVLSVLHKMS
jgi:glycosyltransferase involved in cell wall biosynthesis